MPLIRQPCVYCLASGPRGYLYIGVTSDLPRRVYEHRAGIRSGYAHEKGCRLLVRYGLFEDMPTAIAREKQLKNWHRAWKTNLIEENNPYWEDLAVSLGFDPLPQRTPSTPARSTRQPELVSGKRSAVGYRSKAPDI